MPRDFKTFSQNAAHNADNQNASRADNTANYQEIIDKYKNMDSNGLMSSLLSEASKLKREGKLDANSLNNLKSSLSPFLNSDQQNMLNSLINTINEQ